MNQVPTAPTLPASRERLLPPVIAAVRLLRPHQWLKNTLLFVPSILAHQQVTPALASSLTLAFIAFSLCASAVYVANDLVDLSSDRQHPTKKNRVLAAGRLSVPAGIVLFGLVLAAGLVIAYLFLPLEFVSILGGYVILNGLYSFWLKKLVMVDVLFLAGLYTVRLFAGKVVSQAPESEWLLAFSLFFFVSLAFSKRYVELHRLSLDNGHQVQGRAYTVTDLSLIETIGPTSGYIAVLVLALYINSPQIRTLYSHPSIVWLICPVLLYWVSRIWFLAKRGELNEDPVVYAFTDPISLLLAVVVGGLFYMAT